MVRYFVILGIGSQLLLAQQPTALAQQPAADGLKMAFRETAGPSASPLPPKRDLTLEDRGDIFMARKMYREAIETYVKGASTSAVLANKAGIAYHQLLALPLARKHYQLAQKLDPKYAEAVNNLGTVYYAQKNYRKAIGQYKRALKLNPSSASIHSNLGTAYFARKNYKGAFEEYQRALALDPEVFEHRGHHGVLLQERSIAEKAKFHFYLAKTYAKAGQAERALLYMRKSIEEGFEQRNKFMEDSDFEKMRSLPEFQELMKLETRAI